AKPMPISPAIFEFATPVQPVLRWKYGFILSYPRDCILYLNYYSKPFSRRTWNCVYGMTIMFALIFYFLSWFEKRTTGLNYECSFAIELLLTVGGHCQQAFPVLTYASSRRTAYLTFFLYTFVIYTFYTSNLLSYLVNDVDNAVHLDKLFESDYDIAVLDTMKDILYDNYTYHSLYNSFTEIPKQLRSPKFVNMSTALHDIRFKKTALLSDYITMYPSLSRHFSNQEICHLKEIDLSSDVRTYLFSSKHFLFREQFVIGALRAQEAGLFKIWTGFSHYKPLNCVAAHVNHEIAFLLRPLGILVIVYTFAILILFAEIWYYKRYRVWPYIE
ncbi:hypothetical protein ACJJTC_015306, partial [Scirpophaga incertulas]